MSTTDIKGGLTAIMRLSIRRRLSKIAQPGGELNSRVGTTRYVTIEFSGWNHPIRHRVAIGPSKH